MSRHFLSCQLRGYARLAGRALIAICGWWRVARLSRFSSTVVHLHGGVKPIERKALISASVREAAICPGHAEAIRARNCITLGSQHSAPFAALQFPHDVTLRLGGESAAAASLSHHRLA
jgi:hypothetical protein